MLVPPIHVIGRVVDEQTITINPKGNTLYVGERAGLQKIWAETSSRVQSIRDNPIAAQEEFPLVQDNSYTGLFYRL